jgi:hypothetical protein
MKFFLISLIVLMGVWFDLPVSAQSSTEVWISTAATGNMYPTGGTLENPLDGSTEATFDANMNRLPMNCVIHILSGTYETWGSYAWQMQSGQKILGSGRDSTTLQFPLGTPQGTSGTIVIYSSRALTNAEIADLTLDCNWHGGGYTYSGISINGTGNIVRRVRVIHCGNTLGVNSEAWGISLNNISLPMSQGNIIEDCEVSEFSGGPCISAIAMSGTLTNFMTGIIRDNTVILPADPTSVNAFGINGSWVSDMLVEGNYVYGAFNSVYSDTGGWTDTRIINNTFKDCIGGVAFVPGGAHLQNLTVAFNKIDLAATNNISPVAFNFWEADWTNIFIFGNTVDYGIAGSSPGYLIAASDVTGLAFEYNFVDSELANNQLATSYFTNVTRLTMDENYDLFGNPLSGLNTSAQVAASVSPFGLSLVDSVQASSALTSLGLPANPQELVTNGQSGLALGGAFSGNGGGLTNLNWTNVTGAPTFAKYFDLAPTFTNGMNINAGMAYKIGGVNILWASNSAENFVAGNTFMNVIPNGIANTIVGDRAMENSTNANNDTMIGHSAGRYLLSSSANTMVGKNAGLNMTYGNDNVIVGYEAGDGNGPFTNGSQNTLIGDSSFGRARTGNNNLALGYMAGSWLYAGSNNVFIAHQGTSSETNSSGTIYIGDPGVQTSAYIAGTVYAGSGIVGASLVATNGFQCSTNYTPSLWTPVPGSVIFRASNNWMFVISQYSTNAAFKIGP